MVSVSIFDTQDKSLNISLNFGDQFIKSQSQNLILFKSLSLKKQKLVLHIPVWYPTYNLLVPYHIQIYGF